MAYFEIKEGKITICGIVADEHIKSCISVLSLLWGIETKETCNRLNQLMQAFSDMLNTLKEVTQEVIELFNTENKDICDSCKSRRTRHGSSRTGKAERCRYFIKWSEKYRPP